MEIILIFLCLAVLQFLLSILIESRLNASIKHEYGKKLEEFRFEIGKREKAAKIADSFAKWTKYNGKESELLSKKELFDYYEDLNRMSFELTLWIDDKNLLKKIMARFNNQENALSIRDLIMEVKIYISKDKKEFSKSIANDMVTWPSHAVIKKINLYKKD
jgi:hypothetical protein